MTDLLGSEAAITLIAALATIAVFGGLIGERRLFAFVQHLFAGLVTGYLALLAIGEVLVPRVIEPIVAPGTPGSVAGGLLSLAITVLVLLALLHARPAAGVARAAVVSGRWLLIGGLGAWLGFLLVSRLTLLVDRMTFLLVDWLGLGR